MYENKESAMQAIANIFNSLDDVGLAAGVKLAGPAALKAYAEIYEMGISTRADAVLDEETESEQQNEKVAKLRTFMKGVIMQLADEDERKEAVQVFNAAINFAVFGKQAAEE